MLDSVSDPRTLDLWARCAGLSSSALRARCRAAKEAARNSLAFGRMLRVLVISQQHGCDPYDLLDIVDSRTLLGLVNRCGLAEEPTPTVESFLANQKLIDRGENLETVVELLDARGVSIPKSTWGRKGLTQTGG
jgi:hypothetical protein